MSILSGIRGGVVLWNSDSGKGKIRKKVRYWDELEERWLYPSDIGTFWYNRDTTLRD